MDDETVFIDVREIDLKPHKVRPVGPKLLSPRRKESDDSLNSNVTGITMQKRIKKKKTTNQINVVAEEEEVEDES